ncbi:MAG: hypothetical protein IPJ76_12710 [Flavobacteriales bacterium]|nr:MAG: hypothetical protein IPJ76_12710 [Flavobacteriales bacterium]
MKRRLLIGAVLLVAVLLAERREFLFINLNYQIDHLSRGTPFSYAHSAFRSFVAGWSLQALTALKWCMSLVYIAVNALLALALARLLHGDHRYAKPILLIIGAVALAALLFHALGYLFTGGMGIAVMLLHMVQYPVVLLVLLVSSSLSRPRTG